ncbi:MAG TPA: DUF3108 domain-containing protein [Thermoanaerobaculia bacterium]|nr:DUF3108 domain-containing protein [Thermoanaerobaculia bacterium]
MLSSKPPSRSSTSGRTPRQGRRSASALLALVLAGPLAASVTANVLPNLGREGLPKDKIAPVPFGEGETLVYTISWLKIEGGAMTLATSRETSPDGVPVHRIRLSAVSNDYVSRFYPVNTHYETWVDARDFSPVRFEKHAREGRYVSDEVEEFDLSRRFAVWRNAKEIRGSGPIPERFQDVISSFYFMRTVPLVPGEETRVDLYSRGKIYRLVVAVLARERVETELGVFDAFKVQPRMHDPASASSVDRNKGKLYLWFSDDARRLPVMARTILPIGSVTARLTHIGGEAQAPLAPPPPSPVPAPAAR